MRILWLIVGFILQLLALLLLCAVEIFGILSPYIKLVNFLPLFPLVVMYVFFSSAISKGCLVLLVAGITLIKLLPVIVGGTYISGNVLLFDASAIGMVFQIDPNLLLWNFFPSNQSAGFLMLAYFIVGFIFSYLGGHTRAISEKWRMK